MQIDAVHWFKFNYLTTLYLIIISTRFILIVDTNKQVAPNSDRQMCTKIGSMLSYGKYQTYQMSSNITYVSRVYAQNFLAYSLLDDILIFIEPKHQLHVYNAQTVRLIVNLPTINIVYATSCVSLLTDDRHDLFFLYETRLESNRVSIRVCQIYFDIFKLNFEEKKCIQTLIIRCEIPDIRINGFTIKRDHSGTKKSLLFISSNMGLIYTIFNTETGSLIREPIILNDTLNEGSVVTTSSGIIYYANKQEHTIHEIHITRDFRIRYGKIIKSNAIKLPFGLITDECNHLYISTKSMILIMLIDTYTTIRSVFSKASDLPITIERLNSTTYVYPTVKKYSGRGPAIWMFNFVSFADIEKPTVTTRRPAIKIEEKLDSNHTQIDTTNSPTLSSTSEISEQTSTDQTTLHSLSIEQSTSISSNEFRSSTDDNLPSEHSTLPSEIHLTTQSSTDSDTSSTYVIPTTNPLETLESTAQDLTSADKITISTDVSNEYSQFSTFTSLSSLTAHATTNPEDEYLNDKSTQETSEEKSTFASSLSTEYLYSTGTSLDIESTLLDTTLTTTSEYVSDISAPYFSTPVDQLTTQINDETISTIPWETTSLQNQFHSSTTGSSTGKVTSDLYTESRMTTNLLIDSMETSTYSMTPSDFIDSVSSTFHPSSPFDVFSTHLIPSRSFHSPSLTHSSTTSTKLNRLLSSKYFSVATTTMSDPSTMLSSSINTFETTESAITSDTTEQSSITTFFDESSSSPLITSYPDDTSLLTTAISSEPSTTDYTTLPTTIVSSTILDSTTIVQTDEPSTRLLTTTDNKENLATTTSPPLETTSVSLTTDKYSTEYTSTQSSLEIASTTFPDVYDSTTAQPTLVVTQPKPRSNRSTRRTSELTTSSTTTSTTTTTTIDPYRTRKQKTTRLQSPSSTTTTTTTTITTEIPVTSQFSQLLTSTPIFIWHSKLSSLRQHQVVVIKPSLSTNSSNTLLSNELLSTLFNSTTNSSIEKYIFFNLMDLPPSTWNLSLHTNESVLLDIVLPSPSFPFNLNTTTNLTFTNVEANRFSTNIIGIPINLLVDQIQAKQFSLSMNLTNDQSEPSSSDVVIGHVKSEQFELNITKSDNMNVHVQQVDSETAELFFDSQFCTNESNLQINLNLSKNGTIRYGNRAPLRIGPVFARVHMLKQSCDLDQPFTVFFDICQGQNPCLNGGTCKSQTPDYDSPSYSHQESSQINYQCICPLRVSGEHCEQLQYPFGYCINGGSLFTTFNHLDNKSIEQCLCAQGYQGHHCEQNIDNCINIDCSKHGICQDGMNNYTCACFDGFYGDQCEQKNVETILLQVASKSFATVAILLIAGIAGLFVASDIHTYLTRKKQKPSYRLTKLRRARSELFENSVLLLAFGDAPIEMSDLSTLDRDRKTTPTMQQRPKKIKKPSGYKQIYERRYTRTLEKLPSKHSLLSNRSYESIL